MIHSRAIHTRVQIAFRIFCKGAKANMAHNSYPRTNCIFKFHSVGQVGTLTIHTRVQIALVQEAQSLSVAQTHNSYPRTNCIGSYLLILAYYHLSQFIPAYKLHLHDLWDLWRTTRSQFIPAYKLHLGIAVSVSAFSGSQFIPAYKLHCQ